MPRSEAPPWGAPTLPAPALPAPISTEPTSHLQGLWRRSGSTPPKTSTRHRVSSGCCVNEQLLARQRQSIMNQTVVDKRERRLGGLHARQRLRIETDHETQIFGQGTNSFHVENWYSIHAVIRTTLKLLGLYRRGLKNAEHIQVR